MNKRGVSNYITIVILVGATIVIGSVVALFSIGTLQEVMFPVEENNKQPQVTYQEIDSKEKTYIYDNNGVIAIKKDNNIDYLTKDYLGSTRAVTSSDGNIIYSQDYYPYGSELKEHKEDISYSGKELDEEIGLYYYGARYYSPELGRFTQRDPITQIGESPYKAFNNNPFKYIDPDGRDAEDIRGTYNKKTGYYDYPIYVRGRSGLTPRESFQMELRDSDFESTQAFVEGTSEAIARMTMLGDAIFTIAEIVQGEEISPIGIALAAGDAIVPGDADGLPKFIRIYGDYGVTEPVADKLGTQGIKSFRRHYEKQDKLAKLAVKKASKLLDSDTLERIDSIGDAFRNINNPKDLRSKRRVLKKLGVTFENTKGGHINVIYDDVNVGVLASTPSDWRSYKNSFSEAIRNIREVEIKKKS